MAKKIDVNGLDHYHDKVSAMLASEYSSSKTYAVGDYCFHAGTLYECTTAITTAENWTSGHWTAAKLAEDTSALKTAITQLEDDLGVPQNLYNANTKNVGYRVNISNGTLSGQYDQDASDYVPVVAGKTYVLNFSYWSSASYGMAFYDSTKTFIDGSGIKQSTINASSETVPFVFTVPANAYYLRFSMLQSYTTPVTLYEVVTNKIDLITETALLSDSLYDNGILSFNDVDFTVSSGIRTAASSTLKSDNVNYTHTSISVNSGEIYLVRGVSFVAGYPCWILLDSNGNTVDYSPTSGQTGDIVKTERVLVPENAATLWVNNYTATNYIAIRKAASKNTINGWSGKKIVWFGTSIPAGNTGSGNATGRAYPGILGGLLGATVYNESIGSSRVRGGSYHNITEDDPMGWAGMSAIGVMLSLSLSSAEKQSIADNWDSKWKDIISNPSTVNMSNIETYKASSWDMILPKYLTGGSVGQCDLYVFDHGYNEGVASYGFTELSEVPSTQDDRTYWIGAMNFIIGKILADNPKAKIMIVGHYLCNGSQAGGANYDTKYVCEAQKKFADMWGFYCVPTWNLLGLSCQPITVGGTSKTVVAARFPDAIHPASDTTGKENERYANALLPQFSLAVST